jgi:hypothetical protein
MSESAFSSQYSGVEGRRRVEINEFSMISSLPLASELSGIFAVLDSVQCSAALPSDAAVK